MEKWARISIVTPSFNQGKYIAETIESVKAQDYPNLEHIVIDGGSRDGTLEILRRYPHLTVISEADRGQADAINKGFRFATGEIWGFLNSDDTLVPGALAVVAKEISPEQGRHIVMGRCRFVDESGRFIGIEHPSHFEGPIRVLAIWKGYTIPQPAVFWTPEVWKRCGSLNETLKFSLDYDLFCRFSRRYKFHFVNQVFATYRLHPESKTEQWSEAERLEDAIRISRQYWGPRFSLQSGRLALSLAWFRFNRGGRALQGLRRSQEKWRQGQFLPASLYALLTACYAPDVIFFVGLYPFLRNSTIGMMLKVFDHLGKRKGMYPQTAAYLDHTEPWADGWAGPRVLVAKDSQSGAQVVIIQGWADLTYLPTPLILTIFVDGEEIGERGVEKTGDFQLEFSLPQPWRPGSHNIEVRANTWFVRHRFARNRDYRPLSFRLKEVRLR